MAQGPVALSAAASPDGQPRWFAVPEKMQHFFVVRNMPSFSYSTTLTRCGGGGGDGGPRLLGLWVSTTLLSRVPVEPDMEAVIHTPGRFMGVVNADQLYPNCFLAEKEFECLLLQSGKGFTEK
ncbi:hypothetical protein DQ04_13771000 [Trypanosoma grayi]|uniref:hypothetical protein n=1 Tax=Trypanosoma grayi TaxID=71804 RepID=UPI0004F48C7B|nr:hypothetical protein DQ04_13771000 [Trypanosoma grayi]KEG06467.1 hypothetical protein DQ04_13771000 [Trypanosoma grayi]